MGRLRRAARRALRRPRHCTGNALRAHSRALCLALRVGGPQVCLERHATSAAAAREPLVKRMRQVIPPVPSLFTRFRPHLAHFPPAFPRFLRVFTPGRGSSNGPPAGTQGQETAGTRAKRRELPPSFDTPDANQRINWLGAAARHSHRHALLRAAGRHFASLLLTVRCGSLLLWLLDHLSICQLDDDATFPMD